MYLSCKSRISICASLFILYSGSVANLSGAFAQTAKQGKLTALEGFAEQTPKFDTRVADVQFQLGANQTILRGSERKNLLHAKTKLRNLRAKADQFYLKTTQDDVVLKALKAKTAAESKPLQGKVDQNGKPLQARIADVPRTPLNTLERDVHAPFQLDLDKLLSKVAPNLSSALDAEIDRAPVKAADRVARQIKEMEPLLNARVPQKDMPSLPPRVQVNAALNRALDSEDKNSKQENHDATAGDTAKLDKALGDGQKMHGDGQKIDGLLGAFMAQFKKPSANSSESTTHSNSVDKTAHEMDSQMIGIKKQAASGADIDAELNAAKNNSHTQIAVSQPDIDAILNARTQSTAKSNTELAAECQHWSRRRRCGSVG